MNILNWIAIFLNIVQATLATSFLLMYSSDNTPLFLFLIMAPLVNLIVIILPKLLSLVSSVRN